jgi:ribosome biogenesis protein BRX1
MIKRKRERETIIEKGDDPEDDWEDQEEGSGSEEEGSASEDEDTGASSAGGASSTKITSTSGGIYRNKQRVLVITSRGITARYRHLLEDLKKMIPHHKKDNKLDTKGDVQTVNEVAEMKSCNQIVYLETRKHQDLYMHVAQSPSGPSVKFHVVNIHTMDELKLTGNSLLGSRPLLNFDNHFSTAPHWRLLKSMLVNCFGTPRGHPKSKPFIDRVMSFVVVKNNIWVRNYQIMDKTDEKKAKKDQLTSLVEIGPRFVLIPIRIFNGSLGGATLYENPAYVSPNEERSNAKQSKGDRFAKRVDNKKRRVEQLSHGHVKDPLHSKYIFKGGEDDSD